MPSMRKRILRGDVPDDDATTTWNGWEVEADLKTAFELFEEQYGPLDLANLDEGGDDAGR